uniref:Helix-turn-helix domain-containing protein n=1 Tax=Desulfovibrio sp. U5L TaxID=596152 RepID=I2Q560_9BACT
MEQLAYKPKDAAKVLGVSKRTLEDWRARGLGPTYVKETERTILYPRRGLEAWLEKRAVRTADSG